MTKTYGGQTLATLKNYAPLVATANGLRIEGANLKVTAVFAACASLGDLIREVERLTLENDELHTRIHGKGLIGTGQGYNTGVLRDALRYRWLRDSDNFPVDEGGGPSGWDQLLEVDREEFDELIDTFMVQAHD